MDRNENTARTQQIWLHIIHDVIHFPKELLFLSDTLPSAVFHVAECHLIHAINPLYLLASWYIYYTRNGVNLLLEMPNKSVFP